MEKKYVVCSLCKRPIPIGPYIFTDNFEKEFWLEKDCKPYWKNRNSGKIYCDSCFYKIYWEPEYFGTEA